MAKLARTKGKMWVNESKRIVLYVVYYNERRYPNTPNEWYQTSEAEAKKLEEAWRLEDEQRLKELEAGATKESTDSPEPPPAD